MFLSELRGHPRYPHGRVKPPRFPILLWRDALGQSTAAVVFNAAIAAVAQRAAILVKERASVPLPGFADVFQILTILTIRPSQRSKAIAAPEQLANVHRQNLRVDYTTPFISVHP